MSESRELATAARQRLTAGQQDLTLAWRSKKNGPAMLKGRALLVDGVLRELWTALNMPASCALAAVGGYGHGQLYPASDVDLLILMAEGQHPTGEPKTTQQLEQLVGLLWDLSLIHISEPTRPY